jgi:hypothetical protein
MTSAWQAYGSAIPHPEQQALWPTVTHPTLIISIIMGTSRCSRPSTTFLDLRTTTETRDRAIRTLTQMSPLTILTPDHPSTRLRKVTGPACILHKATPQGTIPRIPSIPIPTSSIRLIHRNHQLTILCMPPPPAYWERRSLMLALLNQGFNRISKDLSRSPPLLSEAPNTRPVANKQGNSDHNISAPRIIHPALGLLQV